ncbi:hypothetical protein ACFQE5_04950 [Pseudonocardia hispaniensis]|uniref:Uncharacterized protein n=1 Tax=Pseudonocardia hispaniensis TaxID=904933 RepID=A0ABW1IYM9_9PSEU
MILPSADADHSPAQAEALLDRVLTEYRHGLLSAQQLAALLPRLRWRDATGGRFTLGVRSRRWYAWDGLGWVPAGPAPVLRLDAEPEPEPVVDVRTPLEDEPEPRPRTT